MCPLERRLGAGEAQQTSQNRLHLIRSRYFQHVKTTTAGLLARNKPLNDPEMTPGGPRRPSRQAKAVLVGNLYDLKTSTAVLLVKNQQLSDPESSPVGPRRPDKRARAVLIGNLYDLRGAKQFYS